LDQNAENNVDILKALANHPRHTMALKVTALTYMPILKALNVGQRRLYEMFVDITGYDVDAYITKPQVKAYVQKKFGIDASDAEIDEFFKVGKLGSPDKNQDRITAPEYTLNIHAFPAHEPFKNALATKIANFDEKTLKELQDWMVRVKKILEAIKKADVFLKDAIIFYIVLLHDRC